MSPQVGTLQQLIMKLMAFRVRPKHSKQLQAHGQNMGFWAGAAAGDTCMHVHSPTM